MKRALSFAVSALLIGCVAGCITAAAKDGYEICNTAGCGDPVNIVIDK